MFWRESTQTARSSKAVPWQPFQSIPRVAKHWVVGFKLGLTGWLGLRREVAMPQVKLGFFEDIGPELGRFGTRRRNDPLLFVARLATIFGQPQTPLQDFVVCLSECFLIFQSELLADIQRIHRFGQ